MTATFVQVLCFLSAVITPTASSINEVALDTNVWLDTSSNAWGRAANSSWHISSASSADPSELILNMDNFINTSSHFTIEWAFSVQFNSSLFGTQMLGLSIYNGVSRTRCDGYRIGIFQNTLGIWKLNNMNDFSLLGQTSIPTPNSTPHTMAVDVMNGNEIRVEMDGVQVVNVTDSNSSAVLGDGQNIGYIGFKAYNVDATIFSLFVSGEKINTIAMNVDDCVAVTTTMEPTPAPTAGTNSPTITPTQAPTISPSTTRQPTVYVDHQTTGIDEQTSAQTSDRDSDPRERSVDSYTSTESPYAIRATLTPDSRSPLQEFLANVQTFFHENLLLAIGIFAGSACLFCILFVGCCIMCKEMRRKGKKAPVPPLPALLPVPPLYAPSLQFVIAASAPSQVQMLPVPPPPPPPLPAPLVAASPIVTSDYNELLQNDAVVNVLTIGGDEQYDLQPQGSTEVQQWLQNTVKLPQYYRVFIEHGFETLDLVCAITQESDLQEIGIDSIHEQRIILTAIRALGGGNREPSKEQVIEGGRDNHHILPSFQAVDRGLPPKHGHGENKTTSGNSDADEMYAPVSSFENQGSTLNSDMHDIPVILPQNDDDDTGSMSFESANGMYNAKGIADTFAE